ncbi:MAG: hypothetical protein FWD15_01045 [Alphaproteobacteria bacterium]|nr:hypothetical protein [Alphaproteobacteria bacterium]
MYVPRDVIYYSKIEAVPSNTEGTKSGPTKIISSREVVKSVLEYENRKEYITLDNNCIPSIGIPGELAFEGVKNEIAPDEALHIVVATIKEITKQYAKIVPTIFRRGKYCSFDSVQRRKMDNEYSQFINAADVLIALMGEVDFVEMEDSKLPLGRERGRHNVLYMAKMLRDKAALARAGEIVVNTEAAYWERLAQLKQEQVQLVMG